MTSFNASRISSVLYAAVGVILVGTMKKKVAVFATDCERKLPGMRNDGVSKLLNFISSSHSMLSFDIWTMGNHAKKYTL